jgi:hypothetical protein
MTSKREQQGDRRPSKCRHWQEATLTFSTWPLEGM